MGSEMCIRDSVSCSDVPTGNILSCVSNRSPTFFTIGVSIKLGLTETKDTKSLVDE